MTDNTELENDIDFAIEAEFSLNVSNTDHSILTNRDSADQHPVSAITGLQNSLNEKQPTLSSENAGPGITISGSGSSVIISSSSADPAWGNITGTLSNQTDLQAALNGKQAKISDLDTIRSNANSGKSASDTISAYGNIVTHNVGEFATSSQGSKADSALQPNDNITSLTNNAGYITKEVNNLTNYTKTSDLEVALNAKQNTIDSTHKLSADLISDGTTNKVVTQTEKNTWDSKANPSDIKNATITITQGGVTKGSFTTNQSENATISLDAGGGSSLTGGNGITVNQLSQIDINQNNFTFTNLNLYGTLTTTVSPILSGFSYNDYVVPTPNMFGQAVSTSTNWEIVFKFTYQPTQAAYNIQLFFSQTAPNENKFGLGENGVLYMSLSSNNVTFDIGEVWGTTSLVVGNTYYAKFTFDGNYYKAFLSSDGETYIEEASITSSVKIKNTTDIYTIGVHRLSSTSLYNFPFMGSILLDGTYIKINGVDWWRPNWTGGQIAKATNSLYGLVKPDNSTITVNNGVVSANSLTGLTATVSELNYTDGVTSNIQTQLNAKQNTIDLSHKLSADLVINGPTNKTVTQAEKNTWNNKQNAITSSNKLSSDLVEDSGHTNKFVTEEEKTKLATLNLQYVITGDNIDLESVDNSSEGADYGFTYGTLDGHTGLCSDNTWVNNSYSYAKISFYVEEDCDITVRFYQGSEPGHDYGVISDIDEELPNDASSTGSEYWNGSSEGEISSSIVYQSVSAGEHFFTCKYIKDDYSGTPPDLFVITGITLSGGKSILEYDTQNDIGIEFTSNKVTSISSSSTDTEYPSAKCVYDIVGNIEAALNEIRGV